LFNKLFQQLKQRYIFLYRDYDFENVEMYSEVINLIEQLHWTEYANEIKKFLETKN